MNKIKYLAILLIIGVITFIVFNSNTKTNKETILGDVVGTNIIALNDINDICSKISNGELVIGITTPYKYTGSGNTAYKGGTSNYDGTSKDVVISDSYVDRCSNHDYYDTHLSAVQPNDNYKPWTGFAPLGGDGFLAATYDKVNIDDVKVWDDSEPYNRYTYLEVESRDYADKANFKDGTPLNDIYTLRDTERVYFDINMENREINSSKDLRLTINYGDLGGDVDIHNQRSITYYLYAILDNSTYEVYGPYEMDISNVVNSYTLHGYQNNKEITRNVVEYSIISENLLKDVPKNKTISIKYIRFYPYENYGENTGSFKIFSLSVDAYDSEYFGKEYININDTDTTVEDRIRHNIVNNMIAMGTLRWRGSNSHKYIVYYADGRGPFEVSSNEILYGIPYVSMRMSNSTLYSFLNNTKKEEVGGSTINTYKTGLIYWSNGVSSKGTVITEGMERTPFTVRIINDNFALYKGGTLNSEGTAYEGGSATDGVNTVLEKYGLTANPPEFINNAGGAYLQGISCSSSAGASYGPEVPYKQYIKAENYVESSQVEIVGGIDITTKEVNDVLLALKNTDGCPGVDGGCAAVQTTTDNYYTSVVQSKYGIDKIYEAYAQTLPGDLIAHHGHVELLTGRTFVQCNNGWSTQYYEPGVRDCNGHGGGSLGIDPVNSYVIKTSLGGSTYEWKGDPNARNDVAFVQNGEAEDGIDNARLVYALDSETGWEYTLD